MQPEQHGAILTQVGVPGFMVDLLVEAAVPIFKSALAATTGELAALLPAALVAPQ